MRSHSSVMARISDCRRRGASSLSERFCAGLAIVWRIRIISWPELCHWLSYSESIDFFALTGLVSSVYTAGKSGKLSMSQTLSSGCDLSNHSTPGRIEVIAGPMFSGKSEELIRRLKGAQIAKRRVLCFKSNLDARYHRTAIASHNSQTLDAQTVANVEGLKSVLFPLI